MTNGAYDWAEAYDRFMTAVSPRRWAGYVVSLWQFYGVKPALVLDLACGTGGVTAELVNRGYDLIGVDNAPEMLSVARERTDALFLEQDMTAFELYGTVDGIVCLCDSVNHLGSAGDLEKMFRLAANYLNHGGLLLFDVNTESYFRSLDGTTFSDATEDAVYVCRNEYFEEERIHAFDIDVFISRQNGLYKRFCDTIYESVFDEAVIKEKLTVSGLTFLGSHGAFVTDEPRANEERIFYAAKRC